MASASGTEILQDDGSVTLDESGNVLVSAGDSDCDCCDGNTDACNTLDGCCQNIWTGITNVDSGWSLTSGVVDVDAGDSVTWDAYEYHCDIVGPGGLTDYFIRIGLGSPWDYYTGGGGPIYESVSTSSKCPPFGDALNWGLISAYDRLLSVIECQSYNSVGDLGPDDMPSSFLVSGWEGTMQTNSSQEYTAVTPNYTPWDGILTRYVSVGVGHYQAGPDVVGGGLGSRWSIQMTNGKWLDVFITASYGNDGIFGSYPHGGLELVFEDATLFGHFQIKYRQIGAKVISNVGLSRAYSDSGTGRMQVPLRLVLS